jgi:hypothetical protein
MADDAGKQIKQGMGDPAHRLTPNRFDYEQERLLSAALVIYGREILIQQRINIVIRYGPARAVRVISPVAASHSRRALSGGRRQAEVQGRD